MEPELSRRLANVVNSRTFSEKTLEERYAFVDAVQFCQTFDDIPKTLQQQIINAEASTMKGGAGSGNHGHESVPGHLGGSAPGDGTGSAFNRQEWMAKDPGTRREEWSKLSVSERDRMANAKESVVARRDVLLKDAKAWENTGDIRADVESRIWSVSEDNLTPRSAEMVDRVATNYEESLRGTGMSEDQVRALTVDATDTLLAQEMEAQTRQLGDHGIHHISGNIDRSMEMELKNPNEDLTPEKAAEIYIAQIYHDTGYMTDPSMSGLDEGHPRWSQQNFDENARPMVEAALGKDAGREISNNIRTHDATSIDWVEDPSGSAIRVADNTALFAADKLPPMFRNVSDNIDVLESFHAKEITLADAKSQMKDNIASANLPKGVAERYNQAVDEVSPVTGKFTLGMLGGTIDSIDWNNDHFDIALTENKENTRLQKVLDLGQRQFGKFAETYGSTPEQFSTDKTFTFRDGTGKILLSGAMKAAFKKWMSTMKGGEGSGNFNHESVQGHLGGSAPSGGNLNVNRFGSDWKTVTPSGYRELSLQIRKSSWLSPNDKKTALEIANGTDGKHVGVSSSTFGPRDGKLNGVFLYSVEDGVVTVDQIATAHGGKYDMNWNLKEVLNEELGDKTPREKDPVETQEKQSVVPETPDEKETTDVVNRGDIALEKIKEWEDKTSELKANGNRICKSLDASHNQIAELMGERDAKYTTVEEKRASPEQARLNELHAEQSKLLAEINPALKQNNDAIHALKTEVIESLYINPPGTSSLTVSGDSSKTKSVKTANEFIGRMVSTDLQGQTDVSIDREEKGYRASASVNGDVIKIAPNDGPDVVVHELGHAIESQATGVQQAAIDFRNSRTVGEKPVTLKSIYPSRGYDSSEVTLKDNFKEAYAGRVYTGQKNTEIISMGLESLYRDPIKFAKDDPEYFKFIINAVQGGKK